MKVLFPNNMRSIGWLTMTLLLFGLSAVFAQSTGSKGNAFDCEVKPFYQYRADGRAGRAVQLSLHIPSRESDIVIRTVCMGITESKTVTGTSPQNEITLLLPPAAGVNASTTASITVSCGNQTSTQIVDVPAKKHWTVYIYPHSHVDIGYTALPEDVEKLHVRNIDVGIDIARKTKDYPEGARFIWNTEATWVVEKYLEKATAAQRQSLKEAIQKGWVQIDGGHSNINTSTCSDEELLHFFDNTRRLKKEIAAPITTMVQMDVPGAAWGLVQAARQNGITGMISFPNYFDLRDVWEHKPFYWLAPDGKTKLLFLQACPYGIGYTIKGNKYGLGRLQAFSNDYDRVSTTHPSDNFIDPFIFDETEKLDRAHSPYDIFAMTWSMADNCVIDADLPEAVKAWNEKYAYPKLIISGAKQILDAYEEKYASIIPTYKGDFTEFWTNGLGSAAASVGAGQEAKEDLVQAEILWSLLRSGDTAASRFNTAWENLLLSAEHTWGAQNSKSELAREVEQIKAGYFYNAARQSKALIKDAVKPFTDTTKNGFAIINTLSWKRDGVVKLSAQQSKWGDEVIDDHNRIVLSQRLSTGELIFLAKDIPPLSSRYYRIRKGSRSKSSSLAINDSMIGNDALTIHIDTKSGCIASVTGKKNSYEYVDRGLQLNAYRYLPGVYNGRTIPGQVSGIKDARITLKEKGPLLVSMNVISRGDGVNTINTDINLYKDQRWVGINNKIDKPSTFKKEGLHFRYAFLLPDGVRRMDMPLAMVRPDEDQLKGSNKNWFTIQRWTDISNADHGITWVANQSPLIEWGQLSGDILDGGRQYWHWLKEVPASTTLYSWPMNNHWDTNFPLEQHGVIEENYKVLFHDKFDQVEANRFGMEQNRPLIIVQSARNVIDRPLFTIRNPNIVVSTLRRDRNGALIIRLKSISSKSENPGLESIHTSLKKLFLCTGDKETPIEAANGFILSPYEIITLKVKE